MNNIAAKIEHVQMVGCAHFDNAESFMFCPDEPVPGVVPRYVGRGKAQQMSDGSFEFIRTHKKHSESTLIKKLAHGRVSRTKKGGIQYTFIVPNVEHIDIARALAAESKTAVSALKKYFNV